jgi:hypothetical protein
MPAGMQSITTNTPFCATLFYHIVLEWKTHGTLVCFVIVRASGLEMRKIAMSTASSGWGMIFQFSLDIIHCVFVGSRTFAYRTSAELPASDAWF